MDLVFLLDYSESVGEANFKKSLEFVDAMIEYFGISAVKEGTHVAIIVFANRPKLIFNLESEKVYEKKVALEELCEFCVFYLYQLCDLLTNVALFILCKKRAWASCIAVRAP